MPGSARATAASRTMRKAFGMMKMKIADEGLLEQRGCVGGFESSSKGYVARMLFTYYVYVLRLTTDGIRKTFTWTLPDLGRFRSPTDCSRIPSMPPPLFSVIIPARNEEALI